MLIIKGTALIQESGAGILFVPDDMIPEGERKEGFIEALIASMGR